MQGDYATVFQPVAGYDDVSNGKAHDMTGLKKIDDYSFSATLSSQAGYWYTEVALWTAWVVDQKVIKAAGKEDDQNWASDPATAIGTGPFKMTARTPKQSTDFAPVPNWWGGSTGAITKVHIEIIADQKAQLTKYESGNRQTDRGIMLSIRCGTSRLNCTNTSSRRTRVCCVPSWRRKFWMTS